MGCADQDSGDTTNNVYHIIYRHHTAVLDTEQIRPELC